MSAHWLDTLLHAVQQEQDAEQQEFDFLSRRSWPEQVAAGLMWGPLTITDIQSSGRRRWDVLLRGALSHDGIGPGDRVGIGFPGATIECFGRCNGVERNSIEVRLESITDRMTLGMKITVQRQLDNSTYERYRSCLTRAKNLIDRPTVAKLLLQSVPKQSLDESSVTWSTSLDASQIAAADHAWREGPVSLIHGPPGTGKTEVIVALLQAAVLGGDQPIALADSNAATDNLVRRCAAKGLRALRLGSISRFATDILPYSLDMAIETGTFGKAIQEIQREMIRARTNHQWDALRKLTDERDKLENAARQYAIANAQVLVTTLGSFARLGSTLPRSRLAVIDEATQAIEPALWPVALEVEQMILVGDPHQLGPVIKSKGNILERSLFERLLGTIPAPMLDVQRRMHATIADTVQPIYDHRLRHHPDVAAHTLSDLPGVTPPSFSIQPILWVDTAGAGWDEQQDPTTRSWHNPGEVRIICHAVAELLQAGVSATVIGIITPYNAQVERLQRHPQLVGIEIASVNGFQGREKEVILCSFVRSNADGDLGFVSDLRRLTVAVTRARRLLLCTGDSACLSNAPAFSSWFNQLPPEAWTSIWESPWDNV